MKKFGLLRGCALAAAAALAVGCLSRNAGSMSDGTVTAYSDVENISVSAQAISGLEFTENLKIGWNLGNTFDAPMGETTWGNPVTTKELLEEVKGLGFDTIRIPISWGKHVGPAPDYVIDEAFMSRVDEVVHDALDAGLYVIINSHHDNDIYMPKASNSQHGQEYLSAIWNQIGEHFKNVDNRLIFQTMNEPRVVGTAYEWSINTKNADCMAALEVINELNQAALDAIRAADGCNADRFVIVSPYAGNVGAALSGAFKLPEDSAEDRLIVSIHAYTPYSLALDMHSKDTQFGKKQENEIKSFLKNVNYRFVRNGIPVIIDEMGCLNKDNQDARYAWAKSYVSLAKEYGIPCVWWDNGQINGSGENFGLIDRWNVTLFPQSELVYQGLMDGLAE